MTYQHPPIEKYRQGGTAIRADDLNDFDARLRRLEALSVQAPLTLTNGTNGPNIGLSKYIYEFQEVQLVDDLPPYGAAKAVLLLPKLETEELDWQELNLSSIPPSPSEARDAPDNLGLARGNRLIYFFPVHDNFGIASWRGDKGLIYRSQRQQAGRWMFWNSCPGDQITGSLNYFDTLKAKDFEFPAHAEQKQYVKYAEDLNTNKLLFAFKHDNPPTAGGEVGHGLYIQIARRGTYEVQASVTAHRYSEISGAEFEDKYNAQSFLQLTLEYYCSTSWQTLDQQYLYLPISSGSGGSVNLFGKFLACQDAHGVRLKVAVGGSSGNIRLSQGRIHIKRVFHTHPELGYEANLGNDGVVQSHLPLSESNYQEDFEDFKNGEFDPDWEPSQGAEPPKYNSGYPSNDTNPQWPNLPL